MTVTLDQMGAKVDTLVTDTNALLAAVSAVKNGLTTTVAGAATSATAAASSATSAAASAASALTIYGTTTAQQAAAATAAAAVTSATTQAGIATTKASEASASAAAAAAAVASVSDGPVTSVATLTGVISASALATQLGVPTTGTVAVVSDITGGGRAGSFTSVASAGDVSVGNTSALNIGTFGAAIYRLYEFDGSLVIGTLQGSLRLQSSSGNAVSISSDGSVYAPASVLLSGSSSTLGFETGAGGSATQPTNRNTTIAAINKSTGNITLASAAGSTTPFSFTVPNSLVAATDVISLSQKSGADKYVLLVTNVATGSFVITGYTTGGTTTEQPVINFTVMKGAAS